MSFGFKELIRFLRWNRLAEKGVCSSPELRLSLGLCFVGSLVGLPNFSLKMEAVCVFETFVSAHEYTQRHNPDTQKHFYRRRNVVYRYFSVSVLLKTFTYVPCRLPGRRPNTAQFHTLWFWSPFRRTKCEISSSARISGCNQSNH
jgi:hypothetical protein